MLQGDATKEERDDARHGETIRKEVARIGAECNQAGLDRGIETERRVFQHQGHGEAENDAQCHRYAEREQEDANAMEDGRNENLRSVELRQRSVVHSGANVENDEPRYSLVHDDTDGVIEKTLSENDRVQFRIDFVLLKDGKDGYRIGSRQRRTKYQTFQ